MSQAAEPRSLLAPTEDAPQLPLMIVERTAGAEAGIDPATLQGRRGDRHPTRVTCVDYCPEQVATQDVTDIHTFLAAHRPEWSHVRWIHLEGLADLDIIRGFAIKYELHPLAVEDVLATQQRPKVEDYAFSEEHPGRLFIVARTLAYDGPRLRSQQVCFFLGRKTLLTVSDAAGDFMGPVLQRIRQEGSRVRQNDVSFLLYALLDAIVERLFPLLENFSERLEQLESSVLRAPTADALKRIHRIKRDLLTIRRVAWPTREMIHQLQREEHVCLSSVTHTYLRDVYDHLVRAIDLIETYREYAAGLMETYMSAVSIRMNDIMKTLTIISTIFVPLTFLVGVYGMNMPIPENEWAGSYPIFWAFALTLVSSMVYMFKRRGWF